MDHLQAIKKRVEFRGSLIKKCNIHKGQDNYIQLKRVYYRYLILIWAIRGHFVDKVPSHTNKTIANFLKMFNIFYN